MAESPTSRSGGFVAIQMHPRVFAALGADLVTSDVVAIIELVKNSYDALASEVTVRFSADSLGPFIQISDDGLGMSRQVIEDVWAVVATPYREDNAWTGYGSRRRRASGAKGLGRLSAARLGTKLEMVTKAPDDRCWKAVLDWQEIAAAASLDECGVVLSPCDDTTLGSSGTIITIRDLRSAWTQSEFADLRDNLSRLVSPFESTEDFAIFVDAGDGSSSVLVETPAFLKHPKYTLEGRVEADGTMYSTYTLDSLDGRQRTVERSLTWRQLLNQPQLSEWSAAFPDSPICGPFSFEIRVWDIGPQDTAEISDKWSIAKNQVRKAISAHKGLSVYRDGILVIPKSEGARDWLGLDLRRVSDVGRRISTSQIVGSVRITAEGNPELTDTSDRERLVDTPALAQFKALLFAAVGQLENERSQDRREPAPEPTTSYFDRISAKELVRDIGAAIENGSATPQRTLAIVQTYAADLDKTRQEIQRRFVYYSRLATIGTIAHLLIHEIRNRTSVMHLFITKCKETLTLPKEMEPVHDAALRSVESLDSLAKTFAPLANRNFKREKRHAPIGEQVDFCLSLFKQEIRDGEIQVLNEVEPALIAHMDPGELDAVLVNLISNAVYWLDSVPTDQRRLVISSETDDDPNRATIFVSDSGPGIAETDLESVLEPGFTLKPDGIGMGLTVAGEVVSEYGGKLGLSSPGELGGSTFRFDIPAHREDG